MCVCVCSGRPLFVFLGAQLLLSEGQGQMGGTQLRLREEEEEDHIVRGINFTSPPEDIKMSVSPLISLEKKYIYFFL